MVDAAAEGKQTTSAHINKRSTSTTTQQPPSLRAPRLMRTPRPTTVMTHPTTRTKATTIKPATLTPPKQQTHAQSARRAAPNFKAVGLTASPSIHRPTRGADESLPINVRQNRSFLSAAATQSIQNGNADVAAPLDRSVDASKTNKQIDNRQIKRIAHKNNNNNAGQQQQGSNNSNYQNANDSVARTSAVASEAKVPATASLSPSVTSKTTASSGGVRTTSSIDSKASAAMTNHHHQPPLQRQSKQISNFAARTKVQRETQTLQTDNNGGGTANSTRLPQTPKS